MKIIYNQLGYKIKDKKIAYVLSHDAVEFDFLDIDRNVVFHGKSSEPIFDEDSNENVCLIDFSCVEKEGLYLIKCNEITNFIRISDEVFDNLYDKALDYIENSKCGVENTSNKFSHKICHNNKAKIYGSLKKIEVNGGLHDAGDYGRYVVPGCKVVLDLLFSYLINKDKRLLEVCEHEILWMLKMQRVDGAVYHKVTGLNFPAFDALPEDEKELYVFAPSTQATGDFVAALGLYTYILKLNNNENWKKYYNIAYKSYMFLINNGPILFKNPADCITGEYDDKIDIDERFIAKAAMYLITKDDIYIDDFPYSTDFYSYLGWADMGMYGALLYRLAGLSKYDEIIIKVADQFKSHTNNYNITLTNYPWGSNMVVCNNAIILIYAYKISKRIEYYDLAISHLNYILGTNPLGISYITKVGSYYVTNPHHRLSIAKHETEEGMLVGGPFENLVDEVTKVELTNAPKMKRYIDNVLSYSTNEVCIYWNSPLVWLITLINEF